MIGRGVDYRRSDWLVKWGAHNFVFVVILKSQTYSLSVNAISQSQQSLPVERESGRYESQTGF